MIFVCWKILCQLAPWLLLGMVLSGMLHVLLPKGFVRRKFQGFSGVWKAVLLGVPLPLCSCGVIPAGIGLKNTGASNGAAVGFLISTPQTGIDSILVSASFFGWPFAIFKMVTAGITGVLGGWLTDRVEPGDEAESNSATGDFEQDPVGGVEQEAGHSVLWRISVHGIEIFRSIWGWLIFGIVISALIETFVPTSWFEVVGQWGLFPSMFVVLLVSTPLYVCATASVPIAASLVVGGLSPAAALVFLMAGPATNLTTMGAIHGRFGWKTLAVYLTTIIVGSMFFAWMFDWLLTAEVASHAGHQHDHNHWFSIASALALLAMIGVFAWQDLVRWLRRWQLKRRVDSSDSNIQIPIEGMTCGNCVNRLESAIRNTDGVDAVSVELKSGVAAILGNPNLPEIEQVIESMGYRVGGK